MSALLWVFFFIALVVPAALPETELGPITIDAGVLALGLALFAVIFATRLAGRTHELDSPYTLPFVFVLVTGFFSTMLAYDLLQSLNMWLRYVAYFSLVLFLPLAIASLRQIRLLLAALLVGGILVGAYGLYMFYFHPEIIQVGATGMDAVVKNRVAGTLPNANALGEYLALIIPPAIALLFLKRRFSERLLGGMAIAFLAYVMLLSYSRGSWLALALGIGLFTVLVEKRLALPLVALAFVAAALVPGIADRALSIVTDSTGTGAFRSRLWTIYLSEFASHPITGVGLGNYLEAFEHYNFTHTVTGIISPPFSAHSYYLGTLVEGGLLGLAAILIVIFTVARIGFVIHSRTSKGSEIRILNAGVLGGLLAYFANGLTSSLYTHTRVFILVWLVIGIQAYLFKQAAASEGPDEPEQARSAVLSSRIFRWLTTTPAVQPVMAASSTLNKFAARQASFLDSIGRAFEASATAAAWRKSFVASLVGSSNKNQPA